MKPTTRRWINVGAFVLALVVNGLANVLRFGGNTTGDVSNAINAVFTSALRVPHLGRHISGC